MSFGGSKKEKKIEKGSKYEDLIRIMKKDEGLDHIITVGKNERRCFQTDVVGQVRYEGLKKTGKKD